MSKKFIKNISKKGIKNHVHIRIFFHRLSIYNKNKGKVRNKILQQNKIEKIHKNSSFKKIRGKHYKPKKKNLSNIPNPISPGSGIKYNLAKFQIQEFNDIGEFILKDPSEKEDNLRFINISTNHQKHYNINPLEIFPENNINYQHH